MRCPSLHLTLFLLAALSAPALALPVGGAYPSRSLALKAPSESESEALQLVQADRRRRGLPELEYDALLSAVAREHSEDMLQHQYLDYYSPRLGSLEYRFHRAGISAANVRYAIFQVDSLPTFLTQLAKTQFHADQGRHAGVGVASKADGRGLWITLIVREKFCALEPFPTQPVLGRGYRLAGRLAAGFTKPSLVITYPDGRMWDTPLDCTADGRFESVVRFDQGRGKYDVEVVSEGKLGPVVVELMQCYSNVPYPGPDPAVPPIQTPADMREAERIIYDLINRARGEAGLGPLAWDEAAAAVARGHSEDMRQNKFFAHHSPTQGDVGDRMKRAGVKSKRATENIAGNRDLGAAHRGLMGSPGHRKNILDPAADRVGVGVVASPEGYLYITQNFTSEYKDINTAKARDGILKAVNAARARDRARALRTHETLQRIALKNSEWMAQQGKLGYDKAKSELEMVRLDLKSVQMAVYRSSDPPTPDQVADTLQSRYTDVGIAVTQSTTPDGEKMVWTTVLLGER